MAQKAELNELDVINLFDSGESIANIQRATGVSRYTILRVLAERDGGKKPIVITAGNHSKNRVYLVLNAKLGIKPGDKLVAEIVEGGINLRIMERKTDK